MDEEIEGEDGEEGEEGEEGGEEEVDAVAELKEEANEEGSERSISSTNVMTPSGRCKTEMRRRLTRAGKWSLPNVGRKRVKSTGRPRGVGDS